MNLFSIRILLLLLFLIYPLRSENFWQDLITSNPELKTSRIPHCGFHILLESYQSAQPELLEKIQKYEIETKQKTYDSIMSPSGHFLINYEVSGNNAIPTYDRDQNDMPDYLEFVAKSFDRAWSVEIDTLGFKPPPDENGQAKETYEIFCKRLHGIAAGTFWDVNDEISSLPGNNYPSFIEINTDFSPVNYEGVTDSIVRDSMIIAVSAAHDFNHALQLGYNIWFANPNSYVALDKWYIENSATYMEEVVADQVNDYYGYLPDFFSSTESGITYDSFFNNRIYGEVVLNIMTGELYGRTITREVWQEIVHSPALTAYDKVLRKKGSNLEGELRRLSEWMFFCGSNSISGKYFPEAANYPKPEIISTDNFNNGLQKIFEDQMPPFSFQLLKTPILDNIDNYNIYLSPESIPEEWSGAYFSLMPPKSFGFPAKVYSQLPFQSINVNNDTLYSTVVAANWNGGRTDSVIGYSLFLRDYPGNFESDILVYPNIIKPDQDINYVTFKNVPINAQVEIFSSNGEHISTIHPRFSNDVIFWNLKTFQGDNVGSGVYIYSIVSSNSSQKGKIIVIR